MSRHRRSLLAQFRSGILPLHVETGRWQNKTWTERTCTLCSLNCVEDEFHFLCICELYTVHRNALFERVAVKNADFSILSMEDKFSYLLSFENKEVAKYLELVFDTRKAQVYQ